MGKLIGFVMVFSIVIILANFSGLISEGDLGASTYLMGTMGILDPSGFSGTFFFLTIAGLAIIASGGIIIGTIRGFDISGVLKLEAKLALTTMLLLIGWDFLIIIAKLSEISSFLSIIIGTPILLYYGFQIIEWVTA